MVNKFFVANWYEFQTRKDQNFKGFDIACHYGYCEVIILMTGFMSKALWYRKSAKETFENYTKLAVERPHIKSIFKCLDENGACYDIGVAFSKNLSIFTMGLCLDKQSSVLLRMM